MAKRRRTARSVRTRSSRSSRSVRVKPHTRGPRGPDTGKKPVPVKKYRRRKPKG